MNKNTQPTKQKSTIEILQYNLNRSKATTYSVLNHSDSARFAILMLQEQCWSDYTKSSLTHHSWTLLEPLQVNKTERPRTAIYINNAILKSTYEPVQIP